jgi:hypothetical protein
MITQCVISITQCVILTQLGAVRTISEVSTMVDISLTVRADHVIVYRGCCRASTMFLRD